MIEYVTIRNANRVQIGIIDLFESVVWSRSYYGTGEFEVYAQATADNVALLKVGNYVTRPDCNEVGIIESIEKTFSHESGQMIAARGRFAKSILDRRIIYRINGTKNSPTVIRGNVENAARSLVNANIVNASNALRNVSFIKLGEVAGISKTIVTEDGTAADKQTSYDGLLEYTDALLEEYELGAHMVIDEATKNLLYTVFEGKDRSVGNSHGNQPIIFSQEFDNLISSAYSFETIEKKTTAIIGGEGEGIARFYTILGGNYSGMNRKEVFVDAASISRKYTDENEVEQTYTATEYKTLLGSEARLQLLELINREAFSGEIDTSHTPYQYKEDYDVGDIVTVRDDDLGVEIATRILTVTEAQDQNGYTIGVTFKTQEG